MRGELVNLLNGLHHGLVQPLLDGRQVLAGLAEGAGKVLTRGDHRLAQGGTGRVGGEGLKAIEEIAQIGLQAGTLGLVEKGLHLVHRIHVGIQAGLLGGLLVDAEIQDIVAHALHALQRHAGAHHGIPTKDGRALLHDRDFPRIAGGVGVGDVVGGHLQGALLHQQGLEGDGHGTEKARHKLFPHRGEWHPLGSSDRERVRARIVRQEIQQDVHGAPGTPEQFRMDAAKPAHVGLNGFESAQQQM